MKNDCSLLVMSCDSYSDVWEPFFKLLNKYWKCPYDVYIATETLDCNYAKSLKHTGIWTKRIRESLSEIDTKYVIICCEDMFLKNKVNQDIIDYTIKQFDEDIASFNFELCYENYESDIWGFKKKPLEAKWKNSCQFGIWNRLKLIELMSEDKDPWEWEETNIKNSYRYYINAGIPIFDYGYNKCWFGLRKGKWTKLAIELLNKENINIDFEKRGKYE